MGKSVLELAVETGQWDGGLKKAQSTLSNFVESQGGLSDALSKNSGQITKFVQMMGNMEAKAGTVKGKVKEYETALHNLTATYQKLDDKQKNSDFGKALQQSIGQLTQKAKDAQKAITTVNQSLGTNETQSKSSIDIIGQLAGKLGVSTQMLTKFGLASAAVTAALKVAKDVWMSNEQCVDDWGRTISASEDIYSSFVSSLNNASLGSFFDNINNVIKAAKEAYNALDDLATKGGKIGRLESKLNADIAKQQAIINDKSKSEAERKAAQERLKELNKQRKAAKNETAELNNDVVKSKIKELLTKNGFKEGTAAYNEAVKRVIKGLYDANYKMGTVNTGFKGGMRIDNGKTVRYTDEGNRNLDRIVTDKWLEEVDPYVKATWGARASMYESDRMTNRFTQKNITSTTPKTTSSATNKLDDLVAGFYRKLTSSAITTSSNIPVSKFDAEEELKKRREQEAQALGYNAPSESAVLPTFETGSIDDYNNRLQTLTELLNKVAIGSEAYNSILAEMGDLQTELGDKSTKSGDAITEAAKSMSAMGSSMVDFGKAVGSAELGVAGTIAVAIANLVAQFASVPKGVEIWSWIAGTVSGTAALVSAISSIRSATAGSFAEGGVVPGSSNYGDKLMARVNSGETILNQRQQQNALALMDGGNISLSGLNLSAEYNGETLLMVINNHLKRTGKGELATTR